jgi:hypothetical protein
MKNIKILIILLATTALITSCTGYGDKLEFDKTEVYYTNGVTKVEAQNLGKYLISSGFSDGNAKSVQLSRNKENNRYQFRMVTNEKAQKDSTYDFIFQLMAGQISDSVFNGKPVDFHICDNTFKTVKEIKFKKR